MDYKYTLSMYKANNSENKKGHLRSSTLKP